MKKTIISIFVILWTLVFHYESTRFNLFHLGFGLDLPKLRLLFPPAGWIMFFRVDDTFGTAEVYGLNGQGASLPNASWIDPRRIFETRWLGYDNIHRNVMVNVLNPSRAPDFCRYLKRKFPEYEGFAVTRTIWPSVSERPEEKRRGLAYRCP